MRVLPPARQRRQRHRQTGKARRQPRAVQPASPPRSRGRMVVKNGALTVQVTDLADAVQRVNAAVSGVTGAYVAASSTTYRAADDAGVAAAQAQGRTLPPGPPISPIPPRPSPVPGQTAS